MYNNFEDETKIHGKVMEIMHLLSRHDAILNEMLYLEYKYQRKAIYGSFHN